MDQLSEKTAQKVAASRPMDQLSENLDKNCRFAAPMDQLSERPVKCESTVPRSAIDVTRAMKNAKVALAVHCDPHIDTRIIPVS